MNLPTKDERFPLAVTLTLPPSMNGLDWENQIAMTYNLIIGVLRNNGMTYEIKIEMTKEANIHYHLTVYQGEWSKDCKNFDNVILIFKNKMKYIRYVKKLIGFMKVKKCDNLKGWQTYINKCTAQMDELFEKHKLNKFMSNIENNITKC